MTTAISGATGTLCTKDGLYKASDRKAQYIVLFGAGEPFPNFPGGKANKSCTWYLVTGAKSTGTLSDTDGDIQTSGDGGYTGVVVQAGSA